MHLSRRAARARRRGFILSLLAACALLANAILQGTAAIALAGAGGVLVLCAIYVFVWTVRAHGQALWRAPVQLSRSLLSQSQHFPQVHIGRGARTFLAQGKVGGRLQVRVDGIHWTAGSLLMPGPNKASGSLELSWDQVARIAVTNVPYKLPWLGGILEIETQDGLPLRGEFLGSQGALRTALESASGGRFPNSH